jgi:DNA-binding CsgD family transcriptional regulator
MTDSERLSRLVGVLYDAALHAALWPNALTGVAAFVGGSATGLHVRDVARRTGKVHYEVGTKPSYSQLYFDKYVKLDPMSAAYHVLGVGEVTSNSLLIPHSEFVETRFYKEWAQPQGWIDNILVTLEKSSTIRAELVIFRSECDGMADEPSRQRMRLVVPHIRRAVLIGDVIDLRAAEAASFADTLDGLSAGMFLVDGTGLIVHANASGHAMLAANDFLRAADGRLAASDGETDQALREIFAAAGSGDAAVGIRGIAVPLKSRDGECYVAHVLPLTSGERRRAGTNYAAVAALFVHKAALDTPSPPEVIAKTFGLTPSELRVLLGIVEVGGVPETAIALGIAETTVKTHLHHLFAKTDTSRQAELVKLVAGFSNPLVGAVE